MEQTTDPTILRLQKRIGMFERRGLSSDRAGELAELLRLRDADLDDRRMCIECSNLQRDGHCFAARQGWLYGTSTNLTPVTDMLQRCERFDWQKP